MATSNTSISPGVDPAETNSAPSFVNGLRSTIATGNLSSDDAIWILTSTFIIFTMQSGFGLLECGTVSSKNELNIMIKNMVDVIFGGTTFWMFGYAFQFGQAEGANWFCGMGDYLLIHEDEKSEGDTLAHYFFQSSFSTTAATIVSGAMAERTKLLAYIAFSCFNTLIFVFPAHWIWSNRGFLKELQVIDVAGAGPVHILGGTTGLVATLMLKPRMNRFTKSEPKSKMSSPTNAMLGMFMLWWGWLGFNCGSTFGITDNKWILAARSAVATISSSIGGGMVGMGLSYTFKKRKFDIADLINSILGSLVSITGYCAYAYPWEGFIIGCVGAVIVFFGVKLLEDLKIDDPVGCIPVHMMCGVWGLVCIGLFGQPDTIGGTTKLYGVFYGGEYYLLCVQVLCVLIIIIWTVITSTIILTCIDLTIGLRISKEEEILGSDIVEHDFNHVSDDRYEDETIKLLGDYQRLCKRKLSIECEQYFRKF
ncbi:putative ammonium transporter 3 [Lineus longissimus]|uniref:putative ammonium transporter 3 n=1 Tax=Lineus longissimus TaxID=88925 RepID=UPI002B4C7DA0